MEITEQLIEKLDPNPSCPHCKDGTIDEVERPLGPNTDEMVTHSLCTDCWTTEDGEWFLPPKRRDDPTQASKKGVVTMSMDRHRAEYRGSGKKIMSGALTAYEDIDESYGTNDGTADYDSFISA